MNLKFKSALFILLETSMGADQHPHWGQIVEIASFPSPAGGRGLG